MIKKLCSTLLLAFALLTASKASTVYFPATNWSTSATGPKSAIVTQIGDTVYSDGNYTVVGKPQRFAFTNGVFTNTFYAGTYRLDIDNLVFPKPFYFLVPDDSLTWNVNALRLTNSAPHVIPDIVATLSTNNTFNAAGFTSPITLYGAPFRVSQVISGTTNQVINFKASSIHFTPSIGNDGTITAGSGLIVSSGSSSFDGGAIATDGVGSLTVSSNLTTSTFSIPTNSTPPVDTSTVKGWVNITVPGGGTFKMPLYQ
jgi:hypothetical protein